MVLMRTNKVLVYEQFKEFSETQMWKNNEENQNVLLLSLAEIEGPSDLTR